MRHFSKCIRYYALCCKTILVVAVVHGVSIACNIDASTHYDNNNNCWDLTTHQMSRLQGVANSHRAGRNSGTRFTYSEVSNVSTKILNVVWCVCFLVISLLLQERGFFTSMT